MRGRAESAGDLVLHPGYGHIILSDVYAHR